MECNLLITDLLTNEVFVVHDFDNNMSKVNYFLSCYFASQTPFNVSFSYKTLGKSCKERFET